MGDEIYKELLNNIPPLDFNSYFKGLKDYCKNTKKQKFIFSRRLLDLDKRDFIIFEVNKSLIDKEEIKFTNKKLLVPLDKLFIEIKDWIIYEKDKFIGYNLGGILFTKEETKDWGEKLDYNVDINKSRTLFTASTYWIFIYPNGTTALKPLSISFFDDVLLEDSSKEMPVFKINSNYKTSNSTTIDNSYYENLKIELMNFVKKSIFYILLKAEKKEYSSYKKWTPLGFETKEIIYSRDVSSHKRHFWNDSGRFKIPLMSKDELIKEGYEIDELVFRDMELRRNVPFTIIKQYTIGKDKPKNEYNKIISLITKRNLKCEEKIYRILKEIFPDKIIRRHDRKTLKGLELDFNIPELRLGIEYDGEQHFDKELYKKLYGDGFDAQVIRDKLKNKLCIKKNIKLIRIKYDEELTKTNIKKKLKEKNILWKIMTKITQEK